MSAQKVTLRIKVNAGSMYCGRCPLADRDRHPTCNLFGIDREFERGKYKRLPLCLDAQCDAVTIKAVAR